MSDIPTITASPLPDLRVVARSNPDVFTLLVNAWDTDSRALGTDVFDAVCHRVSNFLRNAAPVEDSAGVLTPAQEKLLDQYVKYVPDVTPVLLAPVEAELGNSGLRNFVDTLYIVDQATRLDITHRRLFDVDAIQSSVLDGPWELKKTSPSRASVLYHDAIAAKKTILPQIDRELVRLRAGNYHHCEYCKSIRIELDGAPVVSRDLESRIANYEESDLTPGQKAALAYADAHMQEPTRVDRALRDRLHENYTTEEIIQITLEVSCWNYQKLLVALALDPRANDEYITLVSIDDHGVIHHGELLNY